MQWRIFLSVLKRKRIEINTDLQTLISARLKLRAVLNFNQINKYYGIDISNRQYIMSYFSFTVFSVFARLFYGSHNPSADGRIRKVGNRFIHRHNSNHTTIFNSPYLSEK